MELLIGAGSSRVKKLFDTEHNAGKEWTDLVTLDIEPRHKPDVVHDLNVLPLPFAADRASEIHAYEVLEHVGRQGDAAFFFAQWSDFWRVLEPGGMFFATVPHRLSPWAFGDPSHTRVIPLESIVFLCQPQYDAQVGKSPMSDFRSIYRADFDLVHQEAVAGGTCMFVLRAVKPSRCTVTA